MQVKALDISMTKTARYQQENQQGDGVDKRGGPEVNPQLGIREVRGHRLQLTERRSLHSVPAAGSPEDEGTGTRTRSASVT